MVLKVQIISEVSILSDLGVQPPDLYVAIDDDTITSPAVLAYHTQLCEIKRTLWMFRPNGKKPQSFADEKMKGSPVDHP
jgi:hypothetical protein